MNRLLFLNALFMAGIVATYPQFFLINPYFYGFTILALFQTFSTAGWVLIILSPLIYALTKSRGKLEFLTVASVLIWPISVVTIRIFLFSSTGDPGWQYLFIYPVFIVSDLLAPIFLAYFLLSRSARRSSVTGQFRAGRQRVIAD